MQKQSIVSSYDDDDEDNGDGDCDCDCDGGRDDDDEMRITVMMMMMMMRTRRTWNKASGEHLETWAARSLEMDRMDPTKTTGVAKCHVLMPVCNYTIYMHRPTPMLPAW